MLPPTCDRFPNINNRILPSSQISPANTKSWPISISLALLNTFNESLQTWCSACDLHYIPSIIFGSHSWVIRNANDFQPGICESRIVRWDVCSAIWGNRVREHLIAMHECAQIDHCRDFVQTSCAKRDLEDEFEHNNLAWNVQLRKPINSRNVATEQ